MNESFLLFFAGMGIGFASDCLLRLIVFVWEKCKKKVGDDKPSRQEVQAIPKHVKPCGDDEKSCGNG